MTKGKTTKAKYTNDNTPSQKFELKLLGKQFSNNGIVKINEAL